MELFRRGKRMNCPKCKTQMKKVKVSVEDTKSKVNSFQCKCGYFEFEKASAKKVVDELKKKGFTEVEE